MEQQELSRETICAIFYEAKHQADYVIELYRHVYPNWDTIEKVDGYPTISKKTNEYIFARAIAFDKQSHPDVLSGGLWLNNGFRTDETMDDWLVLPCEYTLEKA